MSYWCSIFSTAELQGSNETFEGQIQVNIEIRLKLFDNHILEGCLSFDETDQFHRGKMSSLHLTGDR